MHLSYAVIDFSKLKRNFFNIRKKTKNVKIMAVVKADAYGHGIKETAVFLSSLGTKKPEYFAVAFPDEAVELRKAGIKEPILVFEPFTKDQVNDLFRYDLIASVFAEEHIRNLKQGQKRNGKKKIKVHIKINTGMNRLGINYIRAFDFIKKIDSDNNFEIDGIYTHFANSEETSKAFPRLQIKRFNDLLDKLEKNNIKTGLKHAANSGAIIDLPESYYDMVRPGILMYGYYPSLETSESIKLEPVMSIISKVSSKSEIQKGDTVSYSRKFTAKKRTKIVSVPLGYADGFSRGLSNKSQAIIRGKKYQQIGNVSMDRIMFKINNDNIKVGDKVVILGNEKNEEITAWDWCKVLNTIPYEVMCIIGKRIERVYKR